MRITFYGAAQTTTGSMHLVEANGKRILLGLYQGHRKEAFEKNRNLPVDPAKIDYVILSHAHIDHSGNLPQLVRQGFRGRVFAAARRARSSSSRSTTNATWTRSCSCSSRRTCTSRAR